MKRRDAIKDVFSLRPEKLAAANSAEVRETDGERVPAGPVRSMGLALDRLEEESRALQAALAAGAAIVDLDPNLIDPSIVRDRLVESDTSFESLRASIESRGQEVPILVRPHPLVEGRYQVAYGHRRLRVAQALGRPVRAVVRSLSDVELIVAQGIENSTRRDLSYIERALFASRLEERGFARSDILEAVSTDKTELSKMISVVHAIPLSIIEAIGAAPKAGRRRWLTLSTHVADDALREAIEHAVRVPDFTHLDSDERMNRALAAAMPAVPSSATTSVWHNPAGQPAGKITRTSKNVTIAIDQMIEPEFAEFAASHLDALYSFFHTRKNNL